MAKKTKEIHALDLVEGDRLAMLGRIYVVVSNQHGYADYNRRNVQVAPEEATDNRYDVWMTMTGLQPITILKRKK